MDFSDPIIWRGIERILIVIGAIFLSFLGYKLYIKGHSSGKNTLQVDSKLLKFILSGQGPGLFFMAFSALVLIWAISLGQTEIIKEKTYYNPSQIQHQTPEQLPIINRNLRVNCLNHKEIMHNKENCVIKETIKIAHVRIIE